MLAEAQFFCLGGIYVENLRLEANAGEPGYLFNFSISEQRIYIS